MEELVKEVFIEMIVCVEVLVHAAVGVVSVNVINLDRELPELMLGTLLTLFHSFLLA